MIEPGHEEISIRRQCELVGLNRASYYYIPATESALNLELMRWLDEHYMKTPFYGWPRMTVEAQKAGYAVNHKRPLWLLVMGERRHELTLLHIYQSYGSRFNLEHFFRFGKQKLCLASFQTPDVEREKTWWQLVHVAYAQL